MEQSLAVPLVAFLCLAASVAVGVATHGRTSWTLVLPAPQGLLVGVAGGAVALAFLALALLTVNARADFRRAEVQAQVLAQDATALDEALRAVGPAAEPARKELYRYADGIARQLYSHRSEPLRPTPALLESLRQDLRREIAAMPADAPAAAALAAGRLEVLLRSGDDLLALTPVPGLKWCRPILVGWLMLGLGLLALLTPPRLRSVVVLTGLAGALSVGLFFLEEMANPFQGTFTVSRSIIDGALYTISD